MAIAGRLAVPCTEHSVLPDTASDGLYAAGRIIHSSKHITVHHTEVDESFFPPLWDYSYASKLECCYLDTLGGCCYCCLVESISSKSRSFTGKQVGEIHRRARKIYSEDWMWPCELLELLMGKHVHA